MLAYIPAPWILWASSLDGLFHGKSEDEMDENWGYPGGIPSSGNLHIIYIYTIWL